MKKNENHIISKISVNELLLALNIVFFPGFNYFIKNYKINYLISICILIIFILYNLFLYIKKDERPKVSITTFFIYIIVKKFYFVWIYSNFIIF